VNLLLCHPEQQGILRGQRATCPRCGSFWDLESCAANAGYTETYPSQHLHFDPEIGRLKVATLDRWLSDLGVDVKGETVCEVGFGGGFCLAHLQRRAQDVFGIETISASLSHAASLGIPPAHLFPFQRRPDHLPKAVSLWLFQDSFEHILDVGAFMPWVAANSSPATLLLVVAPDATSWSCRLLGRYWPHKLPEHLFHWSPDGLIALFGRYGFGLMRRFKTPKRISTGQVANHLSLMPSLRPSGPVLKRIVPRIEAWFNIGEMGLVFQRLPKS
jgi:hypothetical protein